MKKLLFLACACLALPASSQEYRREPRVDVQPMLKQLRDYEQLSGEQMLARSDEINDHISHLQEMKKRRGTVAKEVDNAINHYRDIQKKKIKMHKENQ